MVEEEIKLEYKIVQLQKNNENILITSKHLANHKEYQIEMTFPSKDYDYTFILEILTKKHKMRLYAQSYKGYEDGSDLFEALISNDYTYSNDTKLQLIIIKLKEFIEKDEKEPGKPKGQFVLADTYDLGLITQLPICINKVKQIEEINSKKIETVCYCTLSQEFFCLYDVEKDKLRLTFWANLRSLLSFKKSLIGNNMTLVWKQQNEIPFEMKLTGTDDEMIDWIIETLIGRIKSFGLQMDIIKHAEGSTPKIDIVKVEKEITQFELQMAKGCNVLIFNKLLSDYEKAIDYYSVQNNPKYEEYTKKIQNLLKDVRYTKYYIK